MNEINLSKQQLMDLILRNYSKELESRIYEYIDIVKNSTSYISYKFKGLITDEPEMFYDKIFWELVNYILVYMCLFNNNKMHTHDKEIFEFVKNFYNLLDDAARRMARSSPKWSWEDIIYLGGM